MATTMASLQETVSDNEVGRFVHRGRSTVSEGAGQADHSWVEGLDGLDKKG
jgi:hypothetical protein